jgi:hypothetical protein
MNPSRKQLVILAVLGVVLVAVYGRAFTRRSPAHPAAVPAGPAAGPQADQPSTPAALLSRQASPQRQAQRQREAALSWTRDPFSRGGGSGAVSGLSLSGILWDVSRPIAIINGEMKQVGEEVEGYRIMGISQDRVSVSDGTESFQVLLAP